MKPRARKSFRYGGGNGVLKRLGAGAKLLRQHIRGRVCWTLEDGTIVSDRIVNSLLRREAIVPCGDGFFDHSFSQTYTLPRLARRAGVSQSTGAGEHQMKMSSFVKKFLKVADLREGPMVTHIAGVKQGSYGPDLILESGETLSLNTTSLVALIRSYGDNSDDWVGKKIEISVGLTEYKKEMVDTIMVKPITPGLTDTAKVEAIVAAGSVGKPTTDMNDDIPFGPSI